MSVKGPGFNPQYCLFINLSSTLVNCHHLITPSYNQRESRARLTLEQQQQYRERNAEQHRTACEGLSEGQLQQYQEQNTDQMSAACAGLSVKQQQQH